jgi:hypothetical protein
MSLIRRVALKRSWWASAAVLPCLCIEEIIMEKSFNEVILHINEDLDEAALHQLEDGVRHDPGVVSVGHDPAKPHMLMVVYDSDSTHASNLLHSFRERGLHAQVVGM